MRDYYTRYPRPILWLIPGGILPSAPEPREIEPFYLSKLPVSNEQFEAFRPDHARSSEAPGDEDPVIGVSFEEARAYCRWYAEVSRKPMRLPSEAEWEHACRAGTVGRFFFDQGEDPADYVQDLESSGGRLRSLEEQRANPHGLYGMLGGVWEWTESDVGSRGALRGGSYRTPRSEISCALRREEDGARSLADVGFRIAKSLRG